MTAFALKAVAIALQQFPQFNATLDLARDQIVSRSTIHIGVAVDTERGLLVPVIRDVDKKSVDELAAELASWPRRRAPASDARRDAGRRRSRSPTSAASAARPSRRSSTGRRSRSSACRAARMEPVCERTASSCRG